MKKHVCILSFSPIYRDARVLRQIEYLSPVYQITVVGEGQPHPDYPQVNWITVEKPPAGLVERASTALSLVLGKLLPFAYDWWYFTRPLHRRMLHHALESRADVYHSNDWDTLPIAVAAARKRGAKVVVDLHEYAPLEFEEEPQWMRFKSPLIRWMLSRYTRQAAAAITVCEPIRRRYREEFGFDSTVILNAPKYVELPVHPVNSERIEVVHHGGAQRSRGLEKMIEAIGLAETRFHFHLILVGEDSHYVEELKLLAERVAPERVSFHDPVKPSEIVKRLSEYDIGFYSLSPTSYNNAVAMPNKLFDFINARLAVVIGPSPAMAELTEQYGFGCVSPTFSAKDLAETLNKLTPESILSMKQAASAAAKQLNADVEMAKVVEMYRGLFDSHDEAAQ